MTIQTISLPESIVSTEFLRLVRFRDIQNGWSVFSDRGRDYSNAFPLISLGDVMKRSKNVAIIQDGVKYRRLTIKLYTKGVGIRDEVDGKDIGTKNQWFVKTGQFIISKIDARNGAFGIVPTDCDGAIATNDFPVFDVDNSKMLTEFLQLISGTEHFRLFCENASTGTTGRRRVDIGKFLDVQIPLPDLETQARIVKAYHDRVNEANTLTVSIEEKIKGIEAYLVDALGITISENATNKGFRKIRFKDIEKWGLDFILGSESQKNARYPFKKLKELCFVNMGASPDSSSLNNNKEGYPFLGGAVEMDEENQKFDISRYCNNPSKLNKVGDIIFCVRATIGKPIFSDRVYCLGRGVSSIEVVSEDILPGYLFHLIKQSIPELQEKGTGSTFKQITKNVLESLELCIPPISVQSEIVKHIEAMKVEINQKKTQAEELRENAKKEFEAELFGIS